MWDRPVGPTMIMTVDQCPLSEQFEQLAAASLRENACEENPGTSCNHSTPLNESFGRFSALVLLPVSWRSNKAGGLRPSRWISQLRV